MIGALQGAQASSSDTLLGKTSWYDQASDVISRLSTIRNSIPDNSGLPTQTAVDQHNSVVSEWAIVSEIYNNDDGSEGVPIVEKALKALHDAPGDILGFATDTAGSAISEAVGRFFKSLSPLVWVILVIAAIGAAFFFIPGLAPAIRGLFKHA